MISKILKTLSSELTSFFLRACFINSWKELLIISPSNTKPCFNVRLLVSTILLKLLATWSSIKVKLSNSLPLRLKLDTTALPILLGFTTINTRTPSSLGSRRLMPCISGRSSLVVANWQLNIGISYSVPLHILLIVLSLMPARRSLRKTGATKLFHSILSKFHAIFLTASIAALPDNSRVLSFTSKS